MVPKIFLQNNASVTKAIRKVAQQKRRSSESRGRLANMEVRHGDRSLRPCLARVRCFPLTRCGPPDCSFCAQEKDIDQAKMQVQGQLAAQYIQDVMQVCNRSDASQSCISSVPPPPLDG